MNVSVINVLTPLLLFTSVLIGGISTAKAQGGDQILDGIGETDMVARYVLDGNVRDWSRNNLHANVPGSEATFVNDERFGKVLSLSGKKDNYLRLPAEVIADLESLSISGWISLRSDKPGQHLFDFGQNSNQRVFTATRGIAEQSNLQTAMTTPTDKSNPITSPALPINKWTHLIIVIDAPSKTMTTYINGKHAGEAKAIPSLAEIFKTPSTNTNQLYIGKSLPSNDVYLDALLHDLRIYRVPLTRVQVAGIYNNSWGVANEVSVNTRESKDDLPQFPVTQAQLYNTYLTKVSDIEVETEVGHLPRLPAFVEGVYKDAIAGPKVRVLWPSPIDNSAVVTAGRYTITGRVPGTDLRPQATVIIKGHHPAETPHSTLIPFDLNQVSLQRDTHNEATKFIENRDKFIHTLAQTDPNSFLYMFRNAFGQPQPTGAKPLGVWDSQDTKLRGHATGHYLTTIAQAYASTGYDKTLQANFAQKMEYMVNTLYTLSHLSGKPIEQGGKYVSDPTAVPPGEGKAHYDSDLSENGIRTDYWNWGVGFISAYPPDQFIMLENGATYGGQNNQVWAPYYTLHKILAGLIDIYEVSGNQKALDIAIGMSDWVHARLNQLPEEKLIKIWNTYIAGEFGGMNETMAHMYRITKQPKYLDAAKLFDNIDMFFGNADRTHGLAKNVDTFRGLHANQHIPQVVGSIAMYHASDMPEYYKVADNFWYKAVQDYMYSIGGVAGARNPANAECFTSQPATLYENGFSTGGQNETCATYNMLKLTSNLFLFDQRAELMDYYERALYNHILASVAEDSPANTYHVPLLPGSIKQFGNPNMTGFTCCNGTAIESSTKLQSNIYLKSKDNKALFVNLYIPSTLKWEERQITVEQTTRFPKEDHTKLTINGNGQFDLHVRVPHWATNGFIVTINGTEQQVDSTPGSYLKISRNWKDGDVVELKMPFQFHLDPVMDQQNIASLFYGPILLAAQETEARKEWRKVTLDASDISKSIHGDPHKLQFTIDGVMFKPFYDTYGRHSVYLDITLN